MKDRQQTLNMFNELVALRRSTAFKLFAGSGLHVGQFHILSFIKENENAKQQEIADLMNVSPASVANSVRRLEREGLVLKVVDKHDLRSNRLFLTEKGEDSLKIYDKKFMRLDNKMFEGFTKNEEQEMQAYLGRLVANLQITDNSLLKDRRNREND